MGSVAQLRFIQRYASQLEGPFLEVGSRDYGSTQNLRKLFAQGSDIDRSADTSDYVGVDMCDGPGVDVVVDLTGDFNAVDSVLGERRFGTVFCLSVLEHCRNPFIMADNLMRLMRPGGRLCVSVPFAFRLHAYPNDYWRFTPAGVRELFTSVEFRDEDAAWTTGRTSHGRCDFRPIDKELGKIPLSLSAHWHRGHRLRGLTAKMLRVLGKCGPLSWLAGYRYVMPPTDILMIGTLRESE